MSDEAGGKRPRGRPRTFDREAALGKATRVFWEKGFEATSMNDLIEAMGIASPSLYAAYASKEALYAEAIRYYREQYDAVTWDNFRAAPTARAAVGAWLADTAAALSGSVLDIPNYCMLTMSAVGNEGQAELGELVKAGRREMLDRVRDRVRRGVREGDVPAGIDVDALARFVMAVQNGMSVLARDGADHHALQAVADVALDGWDARAAMAEGRSAEAGGR